jgi:dTDP-4-dehydrorhamnose reductase
VPPSQAAASVRLARIVVTGAAGQVGRALVRAAVGRSVTGFTSAEWDITDPAAARDLIEPGDVLINCAAFTDVDGAEAHPERAHAVNATGPEHLATACAAVGARLIHISTDYVFGGAPGRDRPYEPDDQPAPLSVYGRTKLDGERAVLAACPQARIVRTAWVYTGDDGGRDFVSVMRARARAGEVSEVVDDQIGSPTYVRDLVTALLTIVDLDVTMPIVHAANAGAVSRYRQARAVYAAAGADPKLVRPVPSARHPRPAARPGYSALGSVLSERAGLTRLRDWRAALDDALSGIGGAGHR